MAAKLGIRVGAGAAIAALLAAALAVAMPSAVVAVPDTNICSSPTRTLSGGGSQSLNVAAGEVLLLTGGTFTGALDLELEAATLCVAADASLEPRNVKSP